MFTTKPLVGASQRVYGPPATHSQMGYYPAGKGMEAKDDLVAKAQNAGVTWAEGT